MQVLNVDWSSWTKMEPTDHPYSRASSLMELQKQDRQRLTAELTVLQNKRQVQQHQSASNAATARASSDNFGEIAKNAALARLISTAQQHPSPSTVIGTSARAILQGRHEVESLPLQHQLLQKQVVQRLLAESELRERAVLQLAQMEQLQFTKRNIMKTQQQNNLVDTASANLARALLLHQQSSLTARLPLLNNEFNDLNPARTSSLALLNKRHESIKNLNSTVAGSISADAQLMNYQNLRLSPSSLLQYPVARTPTNVEGTLPLLNDQSGSIGNTHAIILEGGLSGYMKRSLNSLVDVGKSEENSPPKKRTRLSPKDFISEATLFKKTPLPSTTALFPLPGLKKKQELKLDLSSTTFSTFRKVWESAGERSKNNPALQKEMFQRKITESRMYYTYVSASNNNGSYLE